PRPRVGADHDRTAAGEGAGASSRSVSRSMVSRSNTSTRKPSAPLKPFQQDHDRGAKSTTLLGARFRPVSRSSDMLIHPGGSAMLSSRSPVSGLLMWLKNSVAS